MLLKEHYVVLHIHFKLCCHNHLHINRIRHYKRCNSYILQLLRVDIYLLLVQINRQFHFESQNIPSKWLFIFYKNFFVNQSFFMLLWFLDKVPRIECSMIFACSFLFFSIGFLLEIKLICITTLWWTVKWLNALILIKINLDCDEKVHVTELTLGSKAALIVFSLILPNSFI